MWSFCKFVKLVDFFARVICLLLSEVRLKIKLFILSSKSSLCGCGFHVDLMYSCLGHTSSSGVTGFSGSSAKKIFLRMSQVKRSKLISCVGMGF